MTPSDSGSHRDDTARKTMLYCPDCGHASSIGGDWRVESDDPDVVYRCPECGTDVTTRPDRERVPA